MKSHTRDSTNQAPRPNPNSPDPFVYRALCGRYVPSWAFSPGPETYCSQCRTEYFKREEQRSSTTN